MTQLNTFSQEGLKYFLSPKESDGSKALPIMKRFLEEGSTEREEKSTLLTSEEERIGGA